MMTVRERFKRLLNFNPVDQLPLIEWAAWWDQTVERWKNEGLNRNYNFDDVLNHFGMDRLICLYATPQLPEPKKTGTPLVTCEDDYYELKKTIFTNASIEALVKSAQNIKDAYEHGDFAVRLWLDGFFWFPRKLFGIEPHLYAFYDYPELMHEINQDLMNFNIKAIKELYSVLVPGLIGMAEDMSYNHGPMLSYEMFCEFLAPYYHELVKTIKTEDTKVFIDSDGDITTMIPWMREVGIEGVYPLERQAGVDLVKIRKDYPDFLMMGGYDKMVMSKNESDMRMEFERLMPVVKSGGYILSVDHQTPPGVSLENYKMFSDLYREYAKL